VKYKVQVSLYGTVAQRAEIEVEAINKEEAGKIAIFMSENEDVGWDEQECVDGWDYQIEDIEELK